MEDGAQRMTKVKMTNDEEKLVGSQRFLGYNLSAHRAGLERGWPQPQQAPNTGSANHVSQSSCARTLLRVRRPAPRRNNNSRFSRISRISRFVTPHSAAPLLNFNICVHPRSSAVKPSLSRISGSQTPHPAFRIPHSDAFTLIEMLIVIAIIAIISAIALPAIKSFKPDPLKTASNQLLNDLAYARRKAIADHTTVYVCFMPPLNLLPGTIASSPGTLTTNDQYALLKSQFTGYAMYEKRSVGDQPGASRPHWITDWRTLPDGTGFPPDMFYGNGVAPLPWPAQIGFGYASFDYNVAGDVIVDPDLKNGPSTRFPSIAFDYRGSLISSSNGNWYSWTPPATPNPIPPSYDNQKFGQTFDCVIPLTTGYANVQGTNWTQATFNELPAGTYTNTYMHVVIDGVTGRARRDVRALR